MDGVKICLFLTRRQILALLAALAAHDCLTEDEQQVRDLLGRKYRTMLAISGEDCRHKKGTT